MPNDFPDSLPSSPPPEPTLPSRLDEWTRRIAAIHGGYARAHGRPPRLFPPVLFSEKIQWRKLFDPSPLFTQLSDKLAVRDFIAARGLGHMLMPLLWQGQDSRGLAAAGIAPPYVLKSTHGSGQVGFIATPDDQDWPTIKRQTDDWLGHDHGSFRTEPGYLAVPRKLIAEAWLKAPDDKPPEEYKIFLFDGIPQIVLHVIIGAARKRHNAFYSLPWRRLDWRSDSAPIAQVAPPPVNLNEMLAAAQTLAAGLDHARVDFYADGAQILIGEITLYSWSGMSGVSHAGDQAMGRLWKIKTPVRRALHAISHANWGTAKPKTA